MPARRLGGLPAGLSLDLWDPGPSGLTRTVPSHEQIPSFVVSLRVFGSVGVLVPPEGPLLPPLSFVRRRMASFRVFT